jgi:hypothetical protein
METDLQAKQQDFKKITEQFSPIAERIRKNALQKPGQAIANEQVALRAEYEKYAQAYKDFIGYVIVAQQHKKFAMRKDQIISDAQYAIAKIDMLLMNKNQEDLEKKNVEKQKELDRKIEDMKKKLNENK